MAKDGDKGAHLVPLITSSSLGSKKVAARLSKYEVSRLAETMSYDMPAPDLFSFARSAVQNLGAVVADERLKANLQAQGTWNGSSNRERLAQAGEPSIGIYIVADGPVDVGDLGALFSRFETQIRRHLRGYGRHEVRVDLEYLAQGSIYAQFAVLRRRRRSKGKQKEPWSRTDKLTVAGILVALGIWLAGDSPFKKANDRMIHNSNVTTIVYTDGHLAVAATAAGTYVTPDLAPRKIGTRTVAPAQADDFVQEATVTLQDGKASATFKGSPLQFPIIDKRPADAEAWQDQRVYTLIGSLKYRDKLPTAIVVTEAFKLAG